MPSTSLKDVKSDHCIPATASDAKKNSNPSNIHTFIYTVYMCLYIYIAVCLIHGIVTLVTNPPKIKKC